MKVLEVSFYELQKIIAYRHIKSKFYTRDLIGEKVIVLNSMCAQIIKEKTNFIGCDNTTGYAFIKEFEFLEDCLNWLNDQ